MYKRQAALVQSDLSEIMAVSNDNKPWCSTKRQGFCCMCFGHLEWLIFTYFNGDCIIIGEI